ncbi:hypothetical protein M231_07182 [Tremella mesenterica]|uniref:Uncharacterized protein n=1 Tax=Tremella mesenterica TaxID=5217 RepID=A0A4V1M341_TREME|nr:hypothetical protein M231_07182 [Tremella mesenterica]
MSSGDSDDVHAPTFDTPSPPLFPPPTLHLSPPRRSLLQQPNTRPRGSVLDIINARRRRLPMESDDPIADTSHDNDNPRRGVRFQDPPDTARPNPFLDGETRRDISPFERRLTRNLDLLAGSREGRERIDLTASSSRSRAHLTQPRLGGSSSDLDHSNTSQLPDVGSSRTVDNIVMGDESSSNQGGGTIPLDEDDDIESLWPIRPNRRVGVRNESLNERVVEPGGSTRRGVTFEVDDNIPLGRGLRTLEARVNALRNAARAQRATFGLSDSTGGRRIMDDERGDSGRVGPSGTRATIGSHRIQAPDDDEVVYTGRRERAGPADVGRPERPDYGRALRADLDQLLDRRAAETRAIINADNHDTRRAVLSPPPIPTPPAERRRARFGGAVLRTNGQQIRFAPPPPTETQPRARPLHARLTRQLPVDPDSSDDGGEYAPPPPGVGEDEEVGRFRRILAQHDQYRATFGGFGAAINRIWDYARGVGPADPYREMMLGERDFLGFQNIGRIPRREEPMTIVARVKTPEHEDFPGFRDTFELPPSPITLDENGKVIPNRKKHKPFIACCSCGDRLLLSSAYRGPEDRVWVLRCGHMMDQKCLDKLAYTKSENIEDLPVLGEEEHVGKKRRVRSTRKPKVVVDRKDWVCPVKGCGKEHVSVCTDGVWTQDEEEGAFQAYA